MVIKQAYTEVFNFGDASTNPFDLVTVRPADGFQELSPTYRLIEDYSRYNIIKYYGIDLDKFSELPRHVIKSMIDIAKKRQEKESAIANDINTDVNNSIRKQETRMRQQVNSSFPDL